MERLGAKRMSGPRLKAGVTEGKYGDRRANPPPT